MQIGLIAAATGQLNVFLENPNLVHIMLQRETPKCSPQPTIPAQHKPKDLANGHSYGNGSVNGVHKNHGNGSVSSTHKEHANGVLKNGIHPVYANGMTKGSCRKLVNGSINGVHPEHANGLANGTFPEYHDNGLLNGVVRKDHINGSLNGICGNGNGLLY